MPAPSVWELRPGAVNDHAPIVTHDVGDLRSGRFDLNGTAKDWPSPPCVEFDVDRRLRKQRPAADVSLFLPGAVVLSQPARIALGGFLSRFGQLLPLDVQGRVRYLYNVTTLVDCLDPERTPRTSSGTLKRLAFHLNKVPGEPCVFKDPVTARLHVFCNDSAKKLLEQWARDAGLTGLEIRKPRAY